MIFPRSRRGGNAAGRQSRAWLSAVLGLALAACASTPRIPANVILRDVHNNGYALAFDSASRTLASGGSEGNIRLWALPEGKEIAAWKAHQGSVQGLRFTHRDHEILSAAYDGTLARWSGRGTLLQRFTTPAPITGMAMDEDAGHVVTAHGDGHVRLWRWPDFSLLADLPLHHGAIRAVAYHPASGQLASSGIDGRVFYWRLNSEPRALPDPPTDAHDLIFAPRGDFLMGGGWFKLFRWRLADASLTVLRTPHHGIVKSLYFDADGRLASIGRQTDSAVYLLDPRTGEAMMRFQPHALCGTVVRLSPDGRYLASTSDDANVHLWDLQHPLPERIFYGNEPQMNTNERE